MVSFEELCQAVRDRNKKLALEEVRESLQLIEGRFAEYKEITEQLLLSLENNREELLAPTRISRETHEDLGLQYMKIVKAFQQYSVPDLGLSEGPVCFENYSEEEIRKMTCVERFAVMIGDVTACNSLVARVNLCFGILFG